MVDRMNGSGDLPAGWAWGRIDEICDVNPFTDTSDLSPNVDVAFVPMAAVAELSGRVSTEMRRRFEDVSKGFTRFRSGDVIFAKITPCMENGKIAVVPDLPRSIGFGSTEFHVLRPESDVHARYVFHFLTQRGFRHAAKRSMTGAVGQQRVPTVYLKGAVVPVAPAAEQRRIVEKIDELFGEIEAGEQELEKAREGLEAYRRAVLKAAVTGELTREWREKNAPNETGADLLNRILAERRARDNSSKDGELKSKFSRRKTGDSRREDDEISDDQDRQDLPEGWVWTSIGQLFEVFGGATPPRGDASLWDGGIPWVSSGEVAFNRIRETRERITEAGLNSCSTRVHPAGTVLLAMIGEGRTRGQAAILDISACNNQNAAAIRVSATPIPPEYVFYVLLYFYEKSRALGQGGNQPALNQKIVRGMSLPLPSLLELEKIVDSIGHEMSRVDDVQHILETAVATTNMLRQSILATAFSGKLVPQDPADEPASALLERLRAQKAATPAPRRGNRATPKARPVASRAVPPPSAGESRQRRGAPR